MPTQRIGAARDARNGDLCHDAPRGRAAPACAYALCAGLCVGLCAPFWAALRMETPSRSSFA